MAVFQIFCMFMENIYAEFVEHSQKSRVVIATKKIQHIKVSHNMKGAYKMSFWHEARKPSVGGGCISSQKKEGLFSCIRYPDYNQNETEFRIYAQAWIGKGEPEFWFTQGWIELWSRTPVIALDFQEAQRLQVEHLTQLETYIDESLYHKIYASTKFVEAMEHSSKEWLARIYYHDDGRYELEYSNWSEGRAGGMWAVTARRFNTVTYADDLESAREAALLELEEFAAGTYT